jgi:hypothetical protein
MLENASHALPSASGNAKWAATLFTSTGCLFPADKLRTRCQLRFAPYHYVGSTLVSSIHCEGSALLSDD